MTYPAYSGTSAEVEDDEDEDEEDQDARGALALMAVASSRSSMPAELRSRIADAIARGPIGPEESALLIKAQAFLTRLAQSE